MDNMFRDAISFNANISAWDTANVTTMMNTFNGASTFNQNLSGWNVLGVGNFTDFDLNTPSWALPKPPF